MAVGDVLQIAEGFGGSLVRVWGPQSGGGGGSGTPFTDTFTGDGVEDTFTLSVEPDFAVVIVSGVVFGPADYAITGDQLVFTNPPTTATDEIVVLGWVGAGPGAPAEPLAFAQQVGSISGTATGTFADISGASVTLTTGAHRVRISCAISCNISGSDTYGILRIVIDGTPVGSTGQVASGKLGAYFDNVIPGFLSDVLDAGSHTVTIQGRKDGAATTTFGDLDNFVTVEETAYDS